MCGIAGILLPAGKIIESSWLESFDQTLRHRGPDDRGFLRWNGETKLEQPTREADLACGGRMALVHRRLSILDLSVAGWQPMLSADRQHAIVFNGEVYNYRELRQELESLGHIFRSNSDTEVVLAAWCQWGGDAFQRFIGMFALAIVDLTRGVMTLARDPFGVKPLYWAKWKGGIAFASEIPALLVLPGMDRTVSPLSAYEYLAYGYLDRDGRTMLSGIERVPAGYCYEFCLDSADLRTVLRFWDPLTETIDITADDAAEYLREAFIDSVSLHLRSDVPVGIALSGGIDSTSIMGAVSHLGASSNITAFSFISEDPAQSEERWVDLAAERYGVRVHKIRPAREDLAKDLSRLVRSQGEPFATTGMFAQARVFQCVQNLGIKVTLDGQGADELLAGYPTYLVSRIADLLSEFRLNMASSAASSVNMATFARAALMAASPAAEAMLRDFIVARSHSPWLSGKWFQEQACIITRSPELTRRRDRLHDRLEQTFYDTSLPALLRYADRNSMAYSVESRVPFLTPKLVKFILSLPSHLLISSDGLTKSIFRRAMQGMVPDQILARRDKIGFSVPEGLWLREAPQWLRISTERALDLLPMLNPRAVNAELERVLAGKRVSDSRLWRCICMALWADEFSIRF